jgi:hypothetical protein
MTRLFLATALVLHLSGVPVVAAVVCTHPGMPVQCCCCHRTTTEESPSGTPVARPSCPCKMAPDVPAPATPTPAAALSSRNPLPVAGIVHAPMIEATLSASLLSSHLPATDDSSPPYLTAAHPRC